ncbi:TraR/DksA family transcriptional regulator [Catellatospora methionotrophica]|uniref:TraR/DksA family transcriptional regulator n=1 Tax=Catellatospora methionotrophica TaxID=121620 RepID=UPI0033F5C507
MMTTVVGDAVDRARLAVALLDRLEQVTSEHEDQLIRLAELRHARSAHAADTAESSGNATDIDNEEKVARSLEHRRDQIIKALARLRDGTYGTCAACRQPIAPERLLASPAATHCVMCQSAAERRMR